MEKLAYASENPCLVFISKEPPQLLAGCRLSSPARVCPGAVGLGITAGVLCITWPSNLDAKLLQSCPTLCHPMDCSPPGSSVHGILQARILEWMPFPPPGNLPNPGIKPASLRSPALAGGFFTTEPPGKPYRDAECPSMLGSPGPPGRECPGCRETGNRVSPNPCLSDWRI